MNSVDGGNPYEAPKASIVAHRAEIKRPRVYEFIAVFCWIISGLGALLSLAFSFLLIYSCSQYGWRWFLFSHNGPRLMLLTALAILTTTTYITAGRNLWADRGKPGLLLSSLAVGLTYLFFWLRIWLRI